MKYIDDLHGKMQRIVTEDSAVFKVSSALGVGEDEAKRLIKEMSFGEYKRILEGDNPFGSFSKPTTNSKPNQPTNQMGIDPEELEVGDMVDYVDSMGNKLAGKIKDLPDAAGRMSIMPDDGTPDVAPPDEVTVRDIMAPDDGDVQKEIQRLQKLAGIGGQIPEEDVDESATGGATGAGAVAAGAAKRINPMSRQHSPHGKAFKSARSKTSEYKRSLSKRRPKK